MERASVDSGYKLHNRLCIKAIKIINWLSVTEICVAVNCIASSLFKSAPSTASTSFFMTFYKWQQNDGAFIFIYSFTCFV